MVLFDVGKDPKDDDDSEGSYNHSRFVRYQFPPEFLNILELGAS